MKTGFLLLAAISIAVVAGPIRARAWDTDATRLVDDLAYERLTPAAKARVDQILLTPIGDGRCRARTLSDSPDLADCLRGGKNDFMRGVRYDPLPICGVARARPCEDGRCASATLKRAMTTLKDGAASPAERVGALEAAAYLVAELHQPLHTADNGDRNGDRFRVTLPGSSDKRLTLYSVWDEDLVAVAVGDEQTGLPYLRDLAEAHGDDWSKGDVDSWVAETHQVAVRDVYGRLPAPPACGKTPKAPELLDRAYIDFGARVVRDQLAKAGVRLAVLLNAALG